MPQNQFDAEAFFSALDSQRQSRQVPWSKVAKESGVSASTLTRMAQGKRPDVDSLAALVKWSGLKADDFIPHEGKRSRKTSDALAQITTYLRADPNLSAQAVTALETTIKVLYEQLRKESES